MTKYESVGWHHRLDGPEFEQTPGVGDGQGRLACYSPWCVHKDVDTKEMQKSKMAAWGGLKNSCEKKRSERQRKKERYSQLNAEFQRIAKRVKKPFLSEQCKEIEENSRLGKTRDLLKKLEIPRETFMK